MVDRPKPPRNNNVMNSRTVGNIKRILSMPCATPPMLVVEAAIPAALMAFWGYLSPDPKELYHKAFGHSALCELKGALLDAHVLPPENRSRTTRFLFRGAEWADLTLWYLFLGDLLYDGIFNWTSNIITMSGCDPAQNQNAASSTQPYGACSADGSLDTLFEWFVDSGRYAPACGSSIVVPPRWKWMAACSVEAMDVNSVPCGINVVLHNKTEPHIYDEHAGEFQHGGGYAPTTVFFQSRSNRDYEMIIGFKGSSTQGAMPDNEIFPKSGSLFMATWP